MEPTHKLWIKPRGRFSWLRPWQCVLTGTESECINTSAQYDSESYHVGVWPISSFF